MTPDDIGKVVIDALLSVAPEADPAQLRPAVSFRDQLDLDSMDFLNFAIALHKALGIDIPESDYRKLMTLDSCVAYLGARLSARAEAGGV